MLHVQMYESDVIVCDDGSHRIQGLLEAYFEIKKVNCEHEKIHYLCEGWI